MPSCKKAYNYIEKANGTHRINSHVMFKNHLGYSVFNVFEMFKRTWHKNGTNVSCKCQSSNVTCIIEQFIILDLEFFTET